MRHWIIVALVAIIAAAVGAGARDLTAEKLLDHSRLPLAWHDQRTALGFA
jgi:hypothetical protein